MAEIGSAFLSIMPSAKGFGRKLDSEVGGEVEGAGKRAGSKFGAAMKVGIGAAIVGVAAVGKFMGDALGEARDAQVVGARTESVIKSMGGAANVSAKQVGDLAAAISNKTAVDDEAIQAGQNLLLTFGNVRNEVGKGNDIFSQSSQLMTDMSVAMGQDMKSSAIQLGKALNDPTKGVTALSRVGVSFTEQQKGQIKALQESGNIMGAQKVILGELKKQFGGAAESMATPAEKAKVAFGNLKEQIGTALLPVVDRVLNAFLDAMPTITRVLEGIGPAFGRIKSFAQPVIGIFRRVFDSFSGGEGASRMGQVVDLVKDVFGSIKSIVRDAVSIVRSLWQRFGGTITNVARAAFNGALGVIRGAFQIIRGIFRTVSAALRGDWRGAWEGIKTILRGAWGVIKSVVQTGWSVIKTLFSAAGSALRATFGRIWDGIKSVVGRAWDGIASSVSDGIAKVIGFVKDVPDRAKSALGNLGSTLYNAGAALIQGLIDGITSKISAVTDKMGELASKVKGFLPGSPVKTGPLRSWNRGGAGKRLVGLLVDGLDDSGPALRAASERMAASLRDPSVQLRSSVSAGAFAPTAAGVGGLSKRDVAAIAEAVRDGAYAGTAGRVEAQGMRRRAGGKA